MDEQQMYEELYEVAEQARENSFAPFSKFHVGAALLVNGDCEDMSDLIYTGANIENSSYGATICAERVAFVKAISEGVLNSCGHEEPFVAIAVSAGEEEAIPCGICRQFMYEFAPDLTIITKRDGQLRIQSLRDLLPEGFRLER